MTVTVYCTHPTPRLQYILHVLFRVLGKVEVTCRPPECFSAGNGPALSYGCTLPDLQEVPQSGILLHDDVLQEMPDVLHHPVHKGFFPSAQNEQIPFDIFASAFCILTDLWSVSGLLPLDEHGRTQDRHHPLFVNGWHTQPVLHAYTNFLMRLLGIQSPEPMQIPDIQITLDIDEPWKHRNKPFPVMLGGFAKSIISGDSDSMLERWNAVIRKNDPYDILSTIPDPEKITLFFLLDRHDPKDGRHTWRNSAYRNLIQKCQDQGFSIGIHPSYTSCITPGRIAYEKARLEEILQTPVYKSRQHFLRFRNPDTFIELENAGIREEYSVCPIHFTGYIRGIAIPFPWYNFKSRQISPLHIVPVMVMDRALQKYQGVQVPDAIGKILTEVNTCKQAGGTCTLLWHNTTLSETGEWKGWKKVWDTVLMATKSNQV